MLTYLLACLDTYILTQLHNYLQLPAPCELLAVDGNYKFPCAKGMVHPMGDGLCHSSPIKANYMKVQVDQVKNYFAYYPLPVPNEEMTQLGQARNSFIQWPRDAIVLTRVSKSQHVDVVHDEGNSIQPSTLTKIVPKSSEPLQGRRKKTTPKKKTSSSKSVISAETLMKRPKELQSLYKRWESLPNPNEGVHIHVEPGAFGSQSFEFMIFREDIHSLVKHAWLDHTIIAWFQLLLHGLMKKNQKNRCGFIFPSWIYADECISNKDGVITKMESVMSHNRELRFFLAPYLQSHHWILLLIIPRHRIAYVLDSLMSKDKTADYYIVKEHVEAAVSMYHEKGGPCDTDKSVPFRWELANVPWYDTTLLTERMLNVMAVTWAKHFSSTYLKHVKN
ncbi:hypothetical protein OSB04_021178 [Centaurea solstitialis]|uniref:DUF8039 domain-containing protein n=1 Tax=Centaurea solstitialis TaxID=347529 RepID=A0AA38T5T9_9ASTR|nr:hypothetical protein OSB04_021178 [Centaurea solstitialis]